MSDKTVIYHQLKSPKGKTYLRSEVPPLKWGWVNSPDRFGKGFWGTLFNFIEYYRKVKLFCINNLMALITAAIFLFVGIATIFVMLFIHYDRNEAETTNQKVHNSSK